MQRHGNDSHAHARQRFMTTEVGQVGFLFLNSLSLSWFLCSFWAVPIYPLEVNLSQNGEEDWRGYPELWKERPSFVRQFCPPPSHARSSSERLYVGFLSTDSDYWVNLSIRFMSSEPLLMEEANVTENYWTFTANSVLPAIVLIRPQSALATGLLASTSRDM